MSVCVIRRAICPPGRDQVCELKSFIGRLATAAYATAFYFVVALAATASNAANLVPNGDFSLGSVGFGSDYALGPSSACGNTLETQYTVGTNPSTWNCSSLVVSVGDHTSGSGKM